MRSRIVAAVILSVLTLAACMRASVPPAAVDTSADEAAIQVTGNSWFEGFKAGDVERVVATYADDAVVMPPNAPPMNSKDALRAFFTSETANIKSAGLEIVNGASTTGVSGDTGWHQGSYTVKAGDGTAVDAGSYMEIWRKRDGKWLIVRDIWNSSNKPSPPAPPAAPASS
ncbi:MAG TPA: DUF4440 domain-containing protein [Candidatus Bathyarchaeia archaeon]|nr:DUF4440 domain-containing protein [Candidatus Bathyarchaeia archaeon]